jgi:hypothetical protein
MNHPLIDALQHAADSTARLCENVARQGYTIRDGDGRPDDELMIARLVDVLGCDRFGVGAVNDRRTRDDRMASAASKAAAATRETWRSDVRRKLAAMAPAELHAVIDGLAHKGGRGLATVYIERGANAADAVLAGMQRANANAAVSQKVAA